MFHHKKMDDGLEALKAVKGKISIGILAVESGCGATHLAVSLAGYLVGAGGMNTTIAEVNKSNAFSKLEMVYNGNEHLKFCESDENSFRILGVQYAKHVKISDIPQLFEQSPCVILDFGSDYQEGIQEFRRCDIGIVVASLREWRLLSFHGFLQEYRIEAKQRNWMFAAFDISPVDRKDLEFYYHIRIKKLPEEPDPFHIKRNNLEFYKTILDRR